MKIARFAALASLAWLPIAACSTSGAAPPGKRAAAKKPDARFEVREIEGGAFDLAREVKTARAKGLKPFLWVSASWCGPCRALKASLGDPRMQDALAGTYLVHVDLDAAKEALRAAGFSPEAIPVFYGLTGDGKGDGRKIDGGAWGDNVAAEMAPPLKRFFGG